MAEYGGIQVIGFSKRRKGRPRTSGDSGGEEPPPSTAGQSIGLLLALTKAE